jgi:hypothetical protein
MDGEALEAMREGEDETAEKLATPQEGGGPE